MYLELLCIKGLCWWFLASAIDECALASDGSHNIQYNKPALAPIADNVSDRGNCPPRAAQGQYQARQSRLACVEQPPASVLHRVVRLLQTIAQHDSMLVAIQHVWQSSWSCSIDSAITRSSYHQRPGWTRLRKSRYDCIPPGETARARGVVNTLCRHHEVADGYCVRVAARPSVTTYRSSCIIFR